MRNNRRISALLSAMMMACTTAAFAAPANVTAAEAKGQFPKQIRNVNEVQEIDLTKMENGKLKYDFNNDKKCDYYDVREMEDAINGLYSDKKYYDVYERVDKNGKKRELHIDKAIECLDYNVNTDIPNRIIEEYDNYIKTTFIKNEDYTIYKLDIKGKINYPINNYELLTCIKGKGLINNQEIKKGDTCLVPAIMKEIIIEGNMIILGTKE